MASKVAPDGLKKACSVWFRRKLSLLGVTLLSEEATG